MATAKGKRQVRKAPAGKMARENAALRRELRATKAAGLAALPEIIRDRPEYDAAFRRSYFEHNIYFDLGEEERRSVALFCDRLTQHGLGRVSPPNFVF